MARIRTVIGLAVLVPVTLSPVLSDSLVNPGTAVHRAPSQRYGFEVVSEKWYHQPSRGTLFIPGRNPNHQPKRVLDNSPIDQGLGRPVWQRELPNFPTRAIVRDDGKYVLTFSTYADRVAPPNEHALALYGPGGKTVVDLPPEAFLSEEDLKKVPRTFSFLKWDEGATCTWEGAGARETLIVNFPWGRVLRIRLATGNVTVQPPLPEKLTRP
jgi:hypothetical protein